MQKDISIKRLCAILLDSFLYYFVSFLPSFLFITLITFIMVQTDVGEDNVILGFLTIICTVLVPISLYSYLNYRHLKHNGATWGYRLLNLQIVSKDGSKLTGKQALKRTILKLFFVPLSIITMFFVITIVVIFGTKGRTHILDSIAGTMAVARD